MEIYHNTDNCKNCVLIPQNILKRIKPNLKSWLPYLFIIFFITDLCSMGFINIIFSPKLNYQ